MPVAKRRNAVRVCTAPRCTVEIPRGKLMCRAHWFELPRILRTEINVAWKERRIRDWSGLCLEARGFFAGVAAPASPEAISAQVQHIMGERA